MATYSSAPNYEIVTYTRSVSHPGNSFQTTSWDLFTVGDNETYRPISMWASFDSGGGRVETSTSIINSNYVSVSGLSITGGGTVYGDINWIWGYLYSGSAPNYHYVPNYSADLNAYNWVGFYQLKEGDNGFDHVYYPGTELTVDLTTYEHDVTGEQAAIKMTLLKTTYP